MVNVVIIGALKLKLNIFDDDMVIQSNLKVPLKIKD